MLKIITVLGLWMAFGSTLIAQAKITGIVYDGDTEEVLPFANIFYNSTTIGTTTDKEGKFSLDFRPEYGELVISFIGYESLSFIIDSTSLNKSFQCYLKPQTITIDEVEIKEKKSKNWYHNLETFKNTFLGTSENARKCRILNEDALIIQYDPVETILTVKAREPIQIINEQLGYTINYDLVEYAYDIKNGYVFYQGFPQFKDKFLGKKLKNKYKKRRKKSYLGSSRHFLKSLIDSTLNKEGFEVREIILKTDPNRPSDSRIEQARMEIREKRALGIKVDRDDSLHVIASFANKSKYTQFLNKNKHNCYSELQRIDENAHLLNILNRWQIIYRKEKPDKNYRSNGNPFKAYKGPQTSVIYLSGKPALINKDGIPFNPRDIIVEEYWSFEHVGDMLPLDYTFRKD